MRHIPEDELHAYLDQGLSRSQCVEIESHLDVCSSCQANRDAIAALRDRTTALLAKLAPPRSFPPPFDSLRRRAASEVSARRRRVQLAAWAASVVAAVAAGWTASVLMGPGSDSQLSSSLASSSPAQPAAATGPVSPAVTPAILRLARPDSTATRQPLTQAIRRSPRRTRVAVPLPPAVPAPELELSTIEMPRPEAEPELDGIWRTMSWDGAQAEAGDKLPHIDGLPVVQVQVQANHQGKQPLMVVAQQLASGEVIRTIEGPATDVSQLLSRRTMSDPAPKVASADSVSARVLGLEPVGRTMAMQRGDRMIAITGALPPDSLLAMIRRLNVEMRSK